jgi:hypothetical protein
MSERKSSGNTGRVERGVLALATLVAMVFTLAGSSRAQAQSTKPQSARARESSPKGQHEGITVHGHWTIEVRNPDGKVVTHREFENSVVPGNGPEALETMILGVWVPQAYRVVLSGTSASQSPANAPAPCSYNSSPATCIIQENVPSSGPNAQTCPNGSQTIFCNLTRNPNSLIGNYPSLVAGSPTSAQPITFTGSAIASEAGYVGEVTLLLTMCYNEVSSPGTTSPAACAAGTYATGTTIQLSGLTDTYLSSPVQVQSGQTVQATVVISFQ